MKDIDLQTLFEDLYRAQQRLSLSELDEVLTQLEKLPVSRNSATMIVQRTLRHSFDEAITESEKRLQELRARYAALPELQPVKRMLRVV
jgi:hypothetical protein